MLHRNAKPCFVLLCALGAAWLVGCGDDAGDPSAGSSGGGAAAGRAGASGGGQGGSPGGQGGSPGGQGGASEGQGGAGGRGGGSSGAGQGGGQGGGGQGGGGQGGGAGGGGGSGGGPGGGVGDVFDPSFGDGGFLSLDQLPSSTTLASLAFGPGGEINLLTFEGPVVRLLADGSPDPSFGVGGVLADVDALAPLALAVQPDGKLVVGGSLSGPGPNHPPALMRFDADGTPDPSFGEGGVATPGEAFEYGGVTALWAQGEGLVAAGTVGLPFQPVTLRFGPEGELDASFNPPLGYHVYAPVPPEPDGVSFGLLQALYVDGGGSAYSCGTGLNVARPPEERNANLLLLRYTPEGRQDPTFGQGGAVYVDYVGQNGSFELTESGCLGVGGAPDGKIVAVGQAYHSVDLVGDGLVLRFLPDGSPDPSFGHDGVYAFRSTDWNRATSVVILPDGSLLVGGFTGASATPKPFLLRLRADGTPDPSFGEAGVVVLERANHEFAPTLLKRQPDGKILVAGAAPKPYLARLNPL